MSNIGATRPSLGVGAAVVQASNLETGTGPAPQVVNNFRNFHSNDQSTLNVSINNNTGALTDVENTQAGAMGLMSLNGSNEEASTARVTGGGNRSSHNTTAHATTEEKIELNDIGVPILPPSLIPYRVSEITFDYCDQPEKFAYSWAFDKSQRKSGAGRNQYAKSNEQVNKFRKQLIHLHGEIVQKGRKMIIKKWVEGFKEDGFFVNRQRPNDMKAVNSIISSRAMRIAFDEDPLFPFCYTVKNIYAQSQDAKLDLWFHDAVRSWLSTRDDGELRFDFHIREAKTHGAKTCKHPILRIAVMSINDMIKLARGNEDTSFYASVRTKQQPSANTTTGKKNEEKARNALRKGEQPDADYFMISIGSELQALGFNQLGINCYLRILKSRYPVLGPNPSLDDFRNMNRKKTFWYATMFAQCAIANDVSEEEAVKYVEAVYRATVSNRVIGPGDYDHCDQIELPSNHPDTSKLYSDSIKAPQHTEGMPPFDTMKNVENSYQASPLPPLHHDFMQPLQRSEQNSWISPGDMPPQQQMATTGQFQPLHYPNQFQNSYNPMAHSNHYQYSHQPMTHAQEFQHSPHQNARSGGVSSCVNPRNSFDPTFGDGITSPSPTPPLIIDKRMKQMTLALSRQY